MKGTIRAAAGLVLAGILSSSAAFADQLPHGSYVESCRSIRMAGGTLLAFCRQRDGRWDQSALADVNSCAGDIGNVNGALTCDRAPLFGSSREERRPRYKPLALCEGIIDPIAHERCLHGF
jgi:hypothetical protein